MATLELKPCPFCGMADNEELSVGFRQECVRPGVWETYWFGACSCGANGTSASSPEEAAEKWNRREYRGDDDTEKCRKCWEDPEDGIKGGGVNPDCPWYGDPDGCNNRALRALAFARFEKEDEEKNGQ